MKRQEAFCGHFAKATLAFATPLGFFNRFLVEEGPNGIKGLDIKKGGIFPVVDGVRSLALEHSVAETNTISRIQGPSGRGPFSEGFTADRSSLRLMVMLGLRGHFGVPRPWRRARQHQDVAHLGSFLDGNPLRDLLKIVKQFNRRGPSPQPQPRRDAAALAAPRCPIVYEAGERRARLDDQQPHDDQLAALGGGFQFARSGADLDAVRGATSPS